MSGLLEKDSIRTVDLTHIDGDFLVVVGLSVSKPIAGVLTSFCAEKTEFMIGM